MPCAEKRGWEPGSFLASNKEKSYHQINQLINLSHLAFRNLFAVLKKK